MDRIAVIANDAFSLVNFRGPLIAEMVARGAKVYAMAPDYSPELEEKVRALGAHPVTIPLDRMRLAPLRDVLDAVRLASLLRSLRITVTFSYFLKPVIFGNLAARLAGVRNRYSLVAGLGYVFTPGGGERGLRRSLRQKLATLALGMAFALSRKVFFQNEDDLRFFADARVLDPAKAILVAGTGVDLARYIPTTLPNGPYRALFVGRLLREKGIRELIEASRILKARGLDCTIAIAGGIDRNPGALTAEQMSSWCSDGLCEWLGSIDDVAAALAQAHVFVLPSYREGKPRSTQEALAMGRPVITTDTVGCRETVEPGRNGWLVQVGDPVSLADAIADSMSNRERLERMGRESRAMAERCFDVRKINDQMLDEMNLQSVSTSGS